jgi:hypothetical protein
MIKVTIKIILIMIKKILLILINKIKFRKLKLKNIIISNKRLIIGLIINF